MDTQQQPAAPPETGAPQDGERAQAERRARRRRLLKGLLAAGAAASPLVLTLRNGARAAAASSYNCIVHNPAPLNGGRCRDGNDPGNEWRHVPETTFTPPFDLNSDTTIDANDYCIVYVDANGVVAGANDGCVNCYGGNGGPNNAPAAGFYAMTDSCWSSFT